jgi:hypothetical protein
VSWTGNAKIAMRGIIGFTFASAGFYVGYFALHERPIDLHLIYVAAAGVLLGGAIIDLDPIYEAAKRLLSLLPSVKFGGSPPAP